jgi:hypothetical protein
MYQKIGARSVSFLTEGLMEEIVSSSVQSMTDIGFAFWHAPLAMHHLDSDNMTAKERQLP